MFQTLVNAWKIPDIRKKLIFTAIALLVFRIGSLIPVPYIDATVFANSISGGGAGDSVLDFFNMMSGGNLKHMTIFALSIQPYINASIIIQLLTVAIPALERMVKDGGDAGRKKQAAIVRYTTIALGILQGGGYYSLLVSSKALVWQTGSMPAGLSHAMIAVIIIATFTAGSTFIMWLGERITENGIGNGISIILFAGIISRGPAAIQSLYALYSGNPSVASVAASCAQAATGASAIAAHRSSATAVFLIAYPPLVPIRRMNRPFLPPTTPARCRRPAS